MNKNNTEVMQMAFSRSHAPRGNACPDALRRVTATIFCIAIATIIWI